VGEGGEGKRITLADHLELGIFRTPKIQLSDGPAVACEKIQ